MRLRVLALVLLIARGVAAAPATMPVEQRIEKVRLQAEAIRIDGKADDWGASPRTPTRSAMAGKSRRWMRFARRSRREGMTC